ncbi:MAG: MIP/aquaporin family protein [Pirellulaceae bacterium]
MKPTLLQAALAEVLGTFLLILFGCGAVHSAVLTGAQAGLWQVAIVWGVAIMLAAYVCGGISGAHINPAITIALALWGRFDWSRVPAYILAQLGGAMLAAAALFLLYGPLLEKKEQDKGVTRGEMGSIVTAMCYGEYYPAPGGMASDDKPYSGETWTKISRSVPFHVAFAAEVLGTAVLALVVFAVTDPRNSSGPPPALAPVFIGLCVAILISIIAPLTQACFNPARDFGPRLFAYIAGWGEAAIPGPNGHGFFTVYILAPTIGAIAGGGLYERVFRSFLPETKAK